MFENESKQAGIGSDSETMPIIKVWYFVYNLYSYTAAKIIKLYIASCVRIRECMWCGFHKSKT